MRSVKRYTIVASCVFCSFFASFFFSRLLYCLRLLQMITALGQHLLYDNVLSSEHTRCATHVLLLQPANRVVILLSICSQCTLLEPFCDGFFSLSIFIIFLCTFRNIFARARLYHKTISFGDYSLILFSLAYYFE